jgi:single-strand DNA-binding protein
MNIAVVLGTITNDIEIKYLSSGSAVTNFSIAYNKKYKGQDGKLVEKASFFDVSAFGKNAETINQYFRKGSRILVRGELEQSQWKAQDGTNRSKITIKLEQFDFIDKNDSNQEQQPRAGQYGGQPNNPQYQQPERPKPTYRQPQSAVPPEVSVGEDEIPF